MSLLGFWVGIPGKTVSEFTQPRIQKYPNLRAIFESTSVLMETAKSRPVAVSLESLSRSALAGLRDSGGKGLRFRFWGSGFQVYGLGFQLWGLSFQM